MSYSLTSPSNRSFLFILLLSFLVITFSFSQSYAQAGWTKSYDNALVVSADEYASKIGKDILEQGGNAVDAAVAVQFALAVTLPRAGNIGGGGFMVIRLADGTVETLDFREVAPSRAKRDMYIKNGVFDPNLSQKGILASGIPGTVDGMVNAIEKYGRLPLEVVMQPAIQLAEEGYLLKYSHADDLNSSANEFKKYEGSTQYFLKENGEDFKEGDLFIQTDLANTLKRVARFGREGFYSGPVADAMIREMRNQGGIFTYSDLRNYESKWRAPLTTKFMDYELHIMPPPSSGSIAVAQILEMIKPFPLQSMGNNSSSYVHLVSEAMRRAFADRSFYLGDPDFWRVPQEELVSSDYNKQRFQNFDENAATESISMEHGNVNGFSESDETTHFSVVDKDGNAVAVTTTLNGSFGSHVSVSGAGFLLNNEMDDFAAQPGKANMFGLLGAEANSIEPGKRMLSSMTPTIVTKNNELSMVLGAAGGPRIITATLQSFLNIAVFGMDAQQAVSAPRFHHQWFPDGIRLENYGFSNDTQSLLETKNHRFFYGSVARVHLIHVTQNGQLSSGVDPRGDGYGAGY